jgi:hypothetical protein
MLKNKPNLLDPFTKTKMHKIMNIHNSNYFNMKKTATTIYKNTTYIYINYLHEHIIVISIMTVIILFLLFRIYYKKQQDKYKIIPEDIDLSDIIP